MGKTVYLVDSGIDGGKIDVGVYHRETIEDDDVRKAYIWRQNDDARKKGHCSYGLLRNIGHELPDDIGRDLRQKRGGELPPDQGESEHIERGVSKENEHRGVGGLLTSEKNTKKKKGDPGAEGRFSRVRSFQSADEDIRYSIRTKEPPKKTITAYKVFYAKDGGLYPPMVANPGGEPTPVGVWLDADVGEMAGTSATGRLQVKSGGKGTQGRGGRQRTANT